MENLSFNIEGNSFVFIQKAEQMRNSIDAITTETKKASDVSNGWTNTMKKAFDVIGGMETLKGFADDVIRVRSESNLKFLLQVYCKVKKRQIFWYLK